MSDIGSSSRQPSPQQIPGQPNDNHDQQASEEFDIENISGINSVKGAIKFMQEGFKAHTKHTSELRQMIYTQAQNHNNSMHELRELIKSIQLNNPVTSKDTNSPPKSTQNLNMESNTTHSPKTDTSITSIAATINRLESKLDHMETARSNGYGTVKKLAPDNLPGPRRPNNLLNFHYRQAKDLSRVDTPRYSTYIKNIWPEALAPEELCEESRPIKNSVHKFAFTDELKDASVDNWQRLYRLQRVLFNEMTPYQSWPSRIIANLSGDFDTVARFIRYKNPSWLLTVEAILTIMRDYNGIQPPISEIASIKKSPDEGELQFLRRVRTIFNRMPIAMTENPATHQVLKYTLRQFTPALWARVEDRGMADSSAEALETAIQLAAQNLQINPTNKSNEYNE